MSLIWSFLLRFVERFYTALWPFLRIGAMLIAVPILSIDAVTVRLIFPDVTVDDFGLSLGGLAGH